MLAEPWVRPENGPVPEAVWLCRIEWGVGEWRVRDQPEPIRGRSALYWLERERDETPKRATDGAYLYAHVPDEEIDQYVPGGAAAAARGPWGADQPSQANSANGGGIMTVAPPEITVVIPAHPARVANGMVKRAVGSALAQTLMPSAVIVEIDQGHEGAAVTRDRALRKVTTEWVAYLDSDDQFKANHLRVLYNCATRTGADVAYSWYDANGFGSDPLPHFGKVFDPERPTQTTITVLEWTELAQRVGFRNPPEGALINGERYGEDFLHTVEMIAAGARIVHTPVRTWIWNLHQGNTSGLPTRGDAITPTGVRP